MQQTHQLLVNRRQDRIGHELVAGVVEVDAVGRQDALLLVVRVVLLEVLDERLAQVAQRATSVSLATLRLISEYSSSFASSLLAPSFFSPMTVGVHRTTRAPASWILPMISFRPASNFSFGVPLGRVLLAVPDVVDADVDDDQRRLLGEHVLLEPASAGRAPCCR